MQIHEKRAIHSSFWLLYAFNKYHLLISIYQAPTMWTGTVFGTEIIGVVKTVIVPALYNEGIRESF